jgi:hypothetical protein
MNDELVTLLNYHDEFKFWLEDALNLISASSIHDIKLNFEND